MSFPWHAQTPAFHSTIQQTLCAKLPQADATQLAMILRSCELFGLTTEHMTVELQQVVSEVLMDLLPNSGDNDRK